MVDQEEITKIGKTLVLEGVIRCEEDIYIHGTIKGEMNTTADVYLEEGGTLEAQVTTRNIQIRGRLSGNVTASDKFVLLPEGSMTGDVKAPRVVIEDGAMFRGRIEMPD